eukprot:133821_1
MEEAISFRLMIESLSIQEFNAFSTKLFTTFNKRELLSKCLFHLLVYQNKHSLNTKYTQNINKLLIDIIQSRQIKNINNENENKTDNDINNTKTLITIPYTLIAKCSSYLKLSEVIKFQYSNRHIYISCKKNTESISRLVKPGWFGTYINNSFGTLQWKIQKLSQFSMVNELRLTVSDLQIITNDNKNPEIFASKFKNVNKLSLEKNRSVNLFHQNDINLTCLNPIQTLEFLSLNNYRVKHISNFLSSLSSNDNIKYLSFGINQHILRPSLGERLALVHK